MKSGMRILQDCLVFCLGQSSLGGYNHVGNPTEMLHLFNIYIDIILDDIESGNNPHSVISYMTSIYFYKTYIVYSYPITKSTTFHDFRLRISTIGYEVSEWVLNIRQT